MSYRPYYLRILVRVGLGCMILPLFEISVSDRLLGPSLVYLKLSSSSSMMLTSGLVNG